MFTKRGQVKFVEIFGVLVVFTFLVVIAIAFFSRLNIQDQKMNEGKRESIDMIETGNAISGLSEIQCSVEGRTDPICIDKFRYCALKELIEENPNYREYYANVFGIEKHIQISVYEANGNMITSICDEGTDRSALFGKTDASGDFVEITDADKDGKALFKPLYVFDPVTKSQRFAFIEVYRLA